MRSRGLVVAIAVVLAIVAAAAVILYTNGVKTNAVSGGTDVVVSSQDIGANISLNTLIDQGAFKTIKVPTDALVQGAVTSVDQLRDQSTTQPILANEQISTSRLSSGTAVAGGTLGISDGHVAVSLKLDAPSAVNGAISRGSYITVYATFNSIKFLKGATPSQMLANATKPAVNGQSATTTLPTITITLIPAVKVLDVVNPAVDSSGKTTGSGPVTLTLDLTPADAQNLVYGQQTGNVYVGLLPPGDTSGHSIPFSVVPLNRVLGKAAP